MIKYFAATVLLLLTGNLAAQTDDSRDFDLQGHRGARGLFPENTVPGFLAALEIGVTTVEMDVVISADSVVVVSHEPWMSDVICSQPDGEPVPPDSRDRFNMFKMSYYEIRMYDCGSRSNPRFPEQEPQRTIKPRLADVLRAAEVWTDQFDKPAVEYNIETKSRPGADGVFHPAPDTFVDLLVADIDRAGVRSRTTIQSFDVRTLQSARERYPDIKLALLLAAGYEEGFERNVENLGFEPEIYSPDFSLVTEELIEKAHSRGMLVIPWTVNTMDDMRRLIDLGVDGLITDYPNRFGDL